MINIKRIKCETCKKYQNISRVKSEIEIIKDQIIEIIRCPNCQRILLVTIIKNNFRYIEILGNSG